MVERIVLCALACGGLPHSPVADLPAGAVIAIADADLTNLLRVTPAVSLLYPSRQAMNEALADLSPDEVTAALERRAAWSADAFQGVMTDWVFRAERQCLALGAAGLATDSAASGALPTFVAATLELLTRLVSDGRYDDTPSTELLVLALEHEALMVSELRALSPEASSELAGREQAMGTLAQMLAERGRADYAQAPAYADAPRAVFLRPRDARIIDVLRSRMQPAVEWRDGLVAPWAASRLGELAQQGYQVRVLYHDAGEFLACVEEATDAQCARAFARQEQRLIDDPTASVAAWLNHLRLEQVLFLRFLVERLQGESDAVAPRIQAMARTETALLMQTLARAGTWQPLGVPNVGGAATTGLATCADAAIADTAVFAAFAKALNNPSLHTRLTEIKALQQAKRGHLKP